MYHFHFTVEGSCICLTLWHEGYDYTQFIMGGSDFTVSWWYSAPVLSLKKKLLIHQRLFFKNRVVSYCRVWSCSRMPGSIQQQEYGAYQRLNTASSPLQIHPGSLGLAGHIIQETGKFVLPPGTASDSCHALNACWNCQPFGISGKRVRAVSLRCGTCF